MMSAPVRHQLLVRNILAIVGASCCGIIHVGLTLYALSCQSDLMGRQTERFFGRLSLGHYHQEEKKHYFSCRVSVKPRVLIV